MPELKCTVQTCTHNKNFYCDLDGIVVGGSDAKRSEETCCDSFEERKENYSNSSMGSMSNMAGNEDVTGSASPLSKIDCKAVECTYNEDCICHAGKISVEGSNACQCEQTECATFNCKCS